MRKPVALILGAIMALTLSPMTSHGSAQCPGAQRDPGDLTTTGYLHGTILYIHSGVVQVPSNPANERGTLNLGSQGCRYTVLDNGVTDTRYLTPGATFLYVSAENYPAQQDNPPGLGCLKFAAGATTALCSGSTEKKLTWSWEPFFPGTSEGFQWDSQVVAIPSTAKVVTTCVKMREYGAAASAAKVYCTTYKTVTP